MNSVETIQFALIVGSIALLLLVGPLLTLLIWNWVMPSLGFMSIASGRHVGCIGCVIFYSSHIAITAVRKVRHLKV